jgi:hypothetical protein
MKIQCKGVGFCGGGGGAEVPLGRVKASEPLSEEKLSRSLTEFWREEA